MNANYKTPMSLAAQQLRDLLNLVLPAVSRDKNRPLLNGVRLEVERGILTCVACDGKRLHAGEIAFEGVDMPSVTLTAKSARALVKKITKAAKEMSVGVAANALHVEWTTPKGRVTFWGDLIDGDYPNWRLCVPHSSSQLVHAVVLTSGAAGRVAKLAGEKVQMHLWVARQTVEFLQGGEVELSEPCHTNGEFSVWLDARFLADALKVGAKMRASDEMSPITFYGASGFAVVMPARPEF